MINQKGCSWLSNGLYIDTTRNNSLKSCCRISSRYQTFSEIQAAMLDPHMSYENLKDTACKKCKIEENHSPESSMRKMAPKLGDAQPGQLAMLQVTFSSFCNFKCLYCNPESSTSIELERQDNVETYANYFGNETGLIPRETYEHEKSIIDILKNTDLSKLTYVGIFGGEPFMARHIEEFFTILDERASPEKIQLQINTNASIIPKQHVLEKIKKYKKVDFRVSCEGYGELAEYIRDGLKWELFERNTLKYKEIFQESNCNLRIHMTNNIWNINRVTDFLDWAHTNKISVITKFADYPSYCDAATILNPDQKEIIIRRLQSHDQNVYASAKKTIINYLNSKEYSPDNANKFTSYTQDMERIRNRSLKEINSELYNWFFE